MTGALADLRVLVLDGLGPTPFAGMLLADHGADVVRVIRPPHRPARHLAETESLPPDQDVVHRGTRSTPLDLKSPDGIERLLDLASQADVLIEGFRPGVAERLGAGPAVILATSPRIVYARLTGFGQASVRAGTAGHDINYLAESGALHAFGTPDGRPRPPINLLGDYAGGGLLAAFGIVAAVIEARTSGRGQVVDAAMVDGVALLTAKLQGLRGAGLLDDRPGTNFIDSGAPFYDTYACADGRHLAVGALEADFYRAFLAGLETDTSTWPDRGDRARWSELRRLIAETIATRTLADWTAAFDARDACVSPVLTFDEAAARHRARGVYTVVGDTLHPAPAPRFDRTPARRPTAPDVRPWDAADVVANWSDGRRRH